VLKSIVPHIPLHPEIVECYNVSGGYDYLVKVVAPSVARFQELMECLLKEDIGIAKLKSRIVLRQPFRNRPDPLGLIAVT
jgi:DNA-binding Lrp family transcriptional regulator